MVRKGGDFLTAFQITSKFNEYESFRERPHLGLDFAMPKDTPLYSIQDGVVSKVLSIQDGSSLGNAVFIKLRNGQEIIYAHLSGVNVKVGDIIHTNQFIGLSGNSGNVFGSNNGYHLHIGLKDIDGSWIDPSQYVPLIQNMGNLVAHHSENIYKLSPADMLNRALESLTDLVINFIYPLIDYSMFI